ncbi:MAG TPA: tRNA (N(6)-L-threonylcarbamoyladenosine(37)-C(2))-methylthiotransferase MtaB [Candidatus Sulfotelmatobacter sp.]|nr:tRNA (N(6)-L-threonylcarbamoyladenosine(37)-C(2))-methylthiotransferase MtaB [Candidatus Sulfotelmatobacter sp.]
MPGFYVENFGCRATQADGAALERQFEERGLSRASGTRDASVVVLNTCTVTTGADQDARAAIRRVRRQNPEARIVVTGCYAQRAPEELAAMPGVDLVVGNSHKHQLAEIALGTKNRVQPSAFVPLENLTENGGQRTENVLALAENREQRTENSIFVSDIFAHTELLAAPVFEAANERTRPNLKIQDGCDNRCSFCVIPYVRGQSRSLEADRIIHEVNTLVNAGYREVVISGINLGRWGRDLIPAESGERPTTNDQRLVPLIGRILAETELEKLRISSVEPMDWSDDLISLVASEPRIAKHAHVPMQSGSDTVLRRMHRKYRPWHYREKIEEIHAAMPQAAIGADVMVGFPGETDSEFEQTRQMIEALPFTYLHVFTYSARPGTPAATMKNQVPVHLARERNRILRELAAEKKLAFMRSFIGKTVEAITLNVVGNDEEGAFTEALTDNYLKLRLRGKHDPNRWRNVSVKNVVDGSLLGTLCESQMPETEIFNNLISQT